MKILTVSDTVVKELVSPAPPPQLSGLDLILGCGDLPPEYLRELRNRHGCPLFYVLGNHDLRHSDEPAGCIDLTGRLHSYRDLTILGFSGSRWYNGNPNQYREREMRALIRRLWFRLWRIKRLDIVITHAPPRGIHDGRDRCHQGFECYRTLILKHSPRFFIHGHIHLQFDSPEERVSLVGTTRVVNSYGYYLLEM